MRGRNRHKTPAKWIISSKMMRSKLNVFKCNNSYRMNNYKRKRLLSRHSKRKMGMLQVGEGRFCKGKMRGQIGRMIIPLLVRVVVAEVINTSKREITNIEEISNRMEEVEATAVEIMITMMIPTDAKVEDNHTVVAEGVTTIKEGAISNVVEVTNNAEAITAIRTEAVEEERTEMTTRQRAVRETITTLLVIHLKDRALIITTQILTKKQPLLLHNSRTNTNKSNPLGNMTAENMEMKRKAAKEEYQEVVEEAIAEVTMEEGVEVVEGPQEVDFIIRKVRV